MSDDQRFRLLEKSAPLNFSETLLQTDLSVHRMAAEGLAELPLSPPSSPSATDDRQRLLVCHDMRGNYLADAYTRGYRFENAFQITDWSCIDIFCYFSHNLISLPPTQWIQVCHRHQVQVMGAFLTEWEAGSEICKELFRDEETVFQLSNYLVQLAEIYKLDGWLINVENPLDPSVEVPLMKLFLNSLSHEMHCMNPHSRVIWYDAVTVDGRLRWQNKVNRQNKEFFDCCDGIFVNYGWTADTPIVSSLFAGIERRRDIYFGIDVWGRGTYGGGKHSCDVALKVLRRHGVSAALFAPGYFLECEVDAERDPLLVQCELNSKYAVFWKQVRGAWRIEKEVESPPFCIDFSQAAGEAVFVQGKRFRHWAVAEDSNSWFYDLSLQHLNYTLPDATSNSLHPIKCNIAYDRAFEGTSSLLISATCPSKSKQFLPLKPCTLSYNDTITIYCVVEKAELQCALGIFIETTSGKVLTFKSSVENCIQNWEVGMIKSG